jgi:hypothetical protein
MSSNESRSNSSSKENHQKERQLENAQNDQERAGMAGSNPETAGPSENLREKAAKAEDKSQESREPA